ncbi:hypothetical protein GW17_00057682, partial [Ensete ventricosum]
VITLCKVEFRLIFGAPSRDFKILAIPNVFTHGKPYEHGFVNKCNRHKLYAKSRFDQFVGYRLGISKYWPFPAY